MAWSNCASPQRMLICSPSRSCSRAQLCEFFLVDDAHAEKAADDGVFDVSGGNQGSEAQHGDGGFVSVLRYPPPRNCQRQRQRDEDDFVFSFTCSLNQT